MEQRLTSLRRKFSSLHIKIRVMNQYRLINIQKNTHIKITTNTGYSNNYLPKTDKYTPSYS